MKNKFTIISLLLFAVWSIASIFHLVSALLFDFEVSILFLKIFISGFVVTAFMHLVNFIIIILKEFKDK